MCTWIGRIIRRLPIWFMTPVTCSSQWFTKLSEASDQFEARFLKNQTTVAPPPPFSLLSCQSSHTWRDDRQVSRMRSIYIYICVIDLLIHDIDIDLLYWYYIYIRILSYILLYHEIYNGIFMMALFNDVLNERILTSTFNIVLVLLAPHFW